MVLFDKPVLFVQRFYNPFELVTELEKKLYDTEIEDLIHKVFKASDAKSIDYVVFCQGDKAIKFKLYEGVIKGYAFFESLNLFKPAHKIFKKAYRRWNKKNKILIKRLEQQILEDERFRIQSKNYDETMDIITFEIDMFDDLTYVDDKIKYFIYALRDCNIQPYDDTKVKCEYIDSVVTEFTVPLTIDNYIKTFDSYSKWIKGFKL